MTKINLNTPMIGTDGKPLKEDGKDLTVRECFQQLLRHRTGDEKHAFSIYSVGIKLTDEALTEIELSKKEFDTLQKVVRENKAKTQMGETPIYPSFLHAQLMIAIGLKEEDI